MATDLTGLKVKDTYNSLLKIGDNSSLSATPDKISDGLGNESILYLSTSQVSIGTLPATGYDLTVNSAIKTGSIDIVGAATAATLRLTGGSGSQGTLSWNTDEETVDIIQNGATLQVGQEVQVHVKNQTGSTITDGTPVYVTGTLGSSGRLTVAPMIADGTIEAKYFLGITTEDIPNGEDGKVTTFGKIRGLDTSAYSEGQTLYVSASTAGAFQTTAPVAPNLDLEVAIVINSHANQGTIFVRAQNGYYLGLLHDVYLNSPTNNQFLVYNSTTSRWENQGIASVGSINLDTVTDNGNTTTNDISVGGITATTIEALNGGSSVGTTISTLKIGKASQTAASALFTNELGQAHTWFGYSDGSNYISGDTTDTGGFTEFRRWNGTAYTKDARFTSSGNLDLENNLQIQATTVIDSSRNITANNMTLSGYLRGAANFVIDPAAYGDETGVVQILGDLRVDGTTTTINSTTVTIDDKNIVLASGSATAADANGAGITIDGASATMTYNSTSDSFVFNKKFNSKQITIDNNVSTGGFSSFDDYQILLYKSSDPTTSYGLGIESFTLMFNSNDNYRFYVDNALKVSINNSGDITANSFIGSLTGNADTASALATARNIAVDGAVTGNADFDGSGDITITTSVNHNHDADYVNVTGDTMTGNLDFNDDVQARFGTGNDFKIYHNATNTLIDNETGAIIIRNFADDQDIVLASDDGAGSITDYLRVDGSEGSVILYHYGSAKLETTSTGVSVTGALSGNISTSSISGGTIDINGTTAINLQYNGSTQLRVDSSGVAYLGTVTFANDGISLTDEDSTTDSFFHANVDYDAGLYTVTSNARYGSDYIQVDGKDSRSGNDRVFVISPKDIGSPDEDAILYLGGDNSITAPNTLMDWHTIEMNALLVKLYANLNIQTGGLLVGGTTVIDSSRNITATSFTGNGSGLTSVDADTLDGYQLSGTSSVSDKIFNNKGLIHSTFTDFNTVMNAGANYLQGGTNGPTGTAGHQWYGFMLGLGSDYGTSTGTTGHYASQLYWGRQDETSNNPYLWARDMESGTWGSWRKMSAGNADNADTLNGVAGSSFLRSDADDTATGKITISNDSSDKNDPALTITSSSASSYGRLRFSGSSTVAGVINRGVSGSHLYFDEDATTGDYHFRSSGRAYYYGNLTVGSTNDTSGKLVVRGDANSGMVSYFQNLDTGTTSYAEVIVRSVDSDNDLRLGTSKSYTDTQWQGGWVFAPRKLLLKSNNDVNIFAGGTANANIVGTFTSSLISLNTNTEVTGKITITGSPAIELTGSGTGTYNKTVIYNDQTYGFLLEATKATDSGSAAKKPITLTWRGGFNSNGGLNLTGDTKLYTDDTGLGIDTTTPAEKLVVMGDIGVGAGGYNGGVYANNTSGSVDKNWGFEVQRTSGVDDYNVRMKYYPVAGTSRACGIYNSASSYFTLYSNQDSDIVITNDLGIGTASPSRKLHVEEATTYIARFAYNANNYVDIKYDGFNVVGGSMVFQTIGTEKMRITTVGNVGIGTTTPSVKLDVIGIVRSYAASNNYAQLNNGSFQAVGNHGGTFMIDVDNNGTADLVNVKKSGSSKFYIQNGGNVGIGTTTPAEKLDVAGTIRSSANEGKIKINSTAANGKQYEFISIDTGNLGLYDGTAYRLWVGGNGNIGMGTTSPSQKLDVNGSVNVGSGIVLLGQNRIDGSSDNLKISADHSSVSGSSTIEFLVDGSEKMRINNSGNVGIGTTSPSQKLHVNGSASIAGNLGIGTTSPSQPLVVNQPNHNDDTVGYDGSTILWRLRNETVSSNPTGRFNLYSNGSSTIQLEGSPSRTTYFNAGNVGIGTTSPSAKLDVNGIIKAGGNQVNPQEYGVSMVGNFGQWQGHGTYNNFNTVPAYWGWNYIQGNTNAPNSNSSQWYRGRFSLGDAYGLGTSANDYWMEIAVPRYNYAGGDAGQMFVRACEDGVEGSWYQVGRKIIGDFTATGDVVAYGSSDRRLKDNITPISNALNKVNAIGGYEFDWNDNQETYEGHDVGVIAQEVEEVMPEVVTTREDGYKAVKYEKLVPLLIESIKELKQEIDELKAKLDA